VLLPAVSEINEKTDISVFFVENKVKGSKTVESLTFTITESGNASKLDAVPIPRPPQLELDLSERNGIESETVVFLSKLKQDFGLSAPQIKAVQEYIETNGMAYVEEKIAVVNSEARPNAARTFLAALKGDWKLPVRRKPVAPTPKPQPLPQERRPEMSDEELAKIREESRAMFDKLRNSLRGGPKEDAAPATTAS